VAVRKAASELAGDHGDAVEQLGALALLGALPVSVLVGLGALLAEEEPLSVIRHLAQGCVAEGVLRSWAGWDRWRQADPRRAGEWCRRRGLSVVMAPSGQPCAEAGRPVAAGSGLGNGSRSGSIAREVDQPARLAPWAVLARQGHGAGQGEGEGGGEGAERGSASAEEPGHVPTSHGSGPFASGHLGRRARILPAERIPVIGIVSGGSVTRYGQQVASELGAQAAALGARVVAPLQGAGLASLQRALAIAERGGAPAPWAVSADPLLNAEWSPGRRRLVERVLALADGALIGNRAIVVDTKDASRTSGAGRSVRAHVASSNDRRLQREHGHDGASVGQAHLDAAVWQAEAGRTVGIGADVLVVVEWDGAERRGPVGAAVDAALVAGAEVCAVPGSVFSPASRGTNRLLADGATMLADAAELEVLIDRVLAGRW